MQQKISIIPILFVTLLISPLSYADVTLSGTLQVEGGSYQRGQWLNETADSLRITNDDTGALTNGAPNALNIDFEEKISDNLAAYGRYSVTFNTSSNQGLNGDNDAWLGLKSNHFHMRFGKLFGVYKETMELIDPFIETSLEAQGTAGGMTGNYYNRLGVAQKVDGQVVRDGNGVPLSEETAVAREWDGTRYQTINYSSRDLVTVGDETRYHHLVYSDQVDAVNNLLEFGVEYHGLSAVVQGRFDDTEATDKLAMIGLQYAHGDPEDPTFIVFVTGSYADVGDSILEPDGNVLEDTCSNWRTGAYYNLKLPNGSLRLGLQYEMAETGTFDNDINPDGGQYIMGSIDYRTGIIAVGAWVANYSSDIEESRRYMTDHKWIDENALSFAIGIKAFLGNHAMLFGGYRQVDSDNDYRDENIFTVGMRYSF
jgi:hypothetical protein